MAAGVSHEYQVIGGLLRHPDLIGRVELTADDFTVDLCGQAFAAMRAIVAEGGLVDVFIVAQRCGGDAVLGDLLVWWKECLIRPESLRELCGAIRAAARGREMSTLLLAAQKTLATGKDPDAVRAKLITRLAGLESAGVSYVHTAKETMAAVVDYLQMAFDARQAGHLVGIPSGLWGVDRLIGGWHKSDLIVVGARPAMGKTAFMVSLAKHAALSGKRVGIASAEMPAVQIGLRMVSMFGQIAATKLRSCNLDDQEFTRLTETAQRYSELAIEVFDKPSCTPGDIAIQARAWQLSGGLDLLMVDYLTRLTPDASSESRVREVGAMVQSLKTLAKTLDIPVICLAQLSRQCENRSDKRPVMSDLRDSGEIEQEADAVMFLYRDSVYNESADPEDAEILLEKNRHGPCGKVRARFIAEQMLWTQPAEPEGYPA